MEPKRDIPNPFQLIVDQLSRIESTLLDLSQKLVQLEQKSLVPTKSIDNTIALAIRLTGLKRKTIYHLVNKREIPHSKKGKKLYFDEQELLDWIKSGKRKTMEELMR